MVSISPGPSSTESCAPVDTTGAPGPIPAVSSYTWTVSYTHLDVYKRQLQFDKPRVHQNYRVSRSKNRSIADIHLTILLENENRNF